MHLTIYIMLIFCTHLHSIQATFQVSVRSQHHSNGHSTLMK